MRLGRVFLVFFYCFGTPYVKYVPYILCRGHFVSKHFPNNELGDVECNSRLQKFAKLTVHGFFFKERKKKENLK